MDIWDWESKECRISSVITMNSMNRKKSIAWVESSSSLWIFKEHSKWSITLHILSTNRSNLSLSSFTCCLELSPLTTCKLSTLTTFSNSISSPYNKKSTIQPLCPADTQLLMSSWKLFCLMLCITCSGQLTKNLKSNIFTMKIST